MTKSVNFDGLEETIITMIKEQKVPSLKNQEMFNNICKTLVLSQSRPLLEFIDILFEKLMYPRKESKSLITLLTSQDVDFRENDVQYQIFDLGHPRILEIVMIRQKILELKAMGNEPWKAIDCTPKLLRKLNQLYLLTVNLLRVLSDYIEVPAHSAFYRKFVTESISDFQVAFETFNSLDFIFQALLTSVQSFGTSDERIFHVDENLLSKIKKFSDNNRMWYEDLMMRSVAVKEYLLVEKKIYEQEKSESHSDSKVGELAIEAIYSPSFEQFVDRRKARLNISNRRIF